MGEMADLAVMATGFFVENEALCAGNSYQKRYFFMCFSGMLILVTVAVYQINRPIAIPLYTYSVQIISVLSNYFYITLNTQCTVIIIIQVEIKSLHVRDMSDLFVDGYR